MIAHLEERLGAKVQGVTVQRVDHVNDADLGRGPLPAAQGRGCRGRAPRRRAPLRARRAAHPAVGYRPAAAGRNGHVRSGADR